MKGVPRINLWLIAILCWIASYVVIRARESLLWAALLSAVLLFGGVFIVRHVRASGVDPVARGRRQAEFHNTPLWMILVGLIIFTAGWISWLPKPASAMAQSWHQWSFDFNDHQAASSEGGFNIKQPNLPRSQSERQTGLNWLWGEKGPGPLPSRLNLSMSNNLAGFLSCNDGPEAFWLSQGRVYIPHFAFSQFDGRRWHNVNGERLRIPPDDSGWSWINSEPSPTAKALAIEHKLTFETARKQALPVLQGAMGIQAPISVENGGVIYAGVKPQRGELIYQGLSQPRVWKDVASEFEVNRQNIKRAYLQTATGELGRLIKTIAEQNFSTAENDLQRLNQLMTWMQNEFTYSLETENKREINPIQNFLSFERRGHCELFATTTALLLREMGIPSRVCYGHARGQFLTISNLFAFRDRDAHAWAEIYLKGYGWTVFDTTPVGNVGTTAELSPPTTAEQLKKEYSDHKRQGESQKEKSASMWLPKSFDGILLGSGLFILISALVVSVWIGKQPKNPTHSAENTPSYLAEIRKIAAESGISNPAAYPLRELLRKLADKGIHSDALSESVAYHYQYTYESADRKENYEQQLAKRLKR